MSVSLRKSPPLSAPTTLEAFLHWERAQEAKYEFDGIRPVAMIGGRAALEGIGEPPEDEDQEAG